MLEHVLEDAGELSGAQSGTLNALRKGLKGALNALRKGLKSALCKGLKGTVHVQQLSFN